VPPQATNAGHAALISTFASVVDAGGLVAPPLLDPDEPPLLELPPELLVELEVPELPELPELPSVAPEDEELAPPLVPPELDPSLVVTLHAASARNETRPTKPVRKALIVVILQQAPCPRRA
jgi:hypothetical protein